jgi:hypothetical protein
MASCSPRLSAGQGGPTGESAALEVGGLASRKNGIFGSKMNGKCRNTLQLPNKRLVNYLRIYMAMAWHISCLAVREYVIEQRDSNIMMKKFAIAGLMAASMVASSAQANLIINGSFETGDLTGWTSTSPYGLNPFGTGYGSGMDGRYWHWLGGHDADVSTSQTVNSLTIGATYALDFITASEFTYSDRLRVSVNGGAATLFTAPPITTTYWDHWVSQHYTFTAMSTSATIRFDTTGSLNASAYDIGLDNVRLDKITGTVPETATWAMMLVGFGAVGSMVRRRRGTSVTFA